MNDMTIPDAPKGVTVSALEQDILIMLAEGKSNKLVANAIGISTASIASLLRRDGIKEFLIELKEARREAIASYVVSVALDTLEDRMEAIEKDEDKSLSSSTRKDHLDMAKMIHDMVSKPVGIGAEKSADDNDPFAKLYANINIIQNKNS